MSAANTLEGKKLRRAIRSFHKDVISSEGPYTKAKYGECQVTGRYTIVDKEHNISQPAWIAITKWHKALTRDMEKDSLKDPDMVKVSDD